jgi:hypothetical protein
MENDKEATSEFDPSWMAYDVIIRDYAHECWDRFLGAGSLLFVGR